MSHIPLIAVILHKVDDKPQRERMPSRRRIAQAMAAMGEAHPVFPAQFPLRPATEDDGPFAILGQTWDLHIPVRKVGDKEVRAIAGWHMPGLDGPGHPLGPPAEWPLDAQFLEPLEHAISFDRVVFTASAPTVAVQAWQWLGRRTVKAQREAGVHADVAVAAVDEAVAAIVAAMNRYNPSIKRIAQPVYMDLKRGLITVDASGAARDAALSAMRSLLSTASLPEGCTEDVATKLSPDVLLRPLDIVTWVIATHPDDRTLTASEWRDRFGRWLLDTMRGGPLYVSLRDPDCVYRVSFGNRMKLTAGEGAFKQKVQAELSDSRRERLAEVVDLAREVGMQEATIGATFDLEIATPDDTEPVYLTLSGGAVIDVDVRIKPLDMKYDAPEPGTMEASTQAPERLSVAADRGLRFGAVFDAFCVMEALWTACFGALRDTRQATIPAVPDPSYTWPLPARGAILYTEADLDASQSSDKRAMEVRRVWGVL